MGYYSKYTVSAYDGQDKSYVYLEYRDDWESTFNAITGFPFYHLDEETRWYDCEEDMIKVSKRYPDLLFEVERIGEDPDDRVIMRFKNGDSESVTGEFVYEDFKRLT